MLECTKQLSQKLHLPLGHKLFVLCRLRILEKEPLVIETSHLDAEKYPLLPEQDFFRASLYEVLEKEYGLQFVRGQEKVGLTYATAEEADLLRVKEQTPVFFCAVWCSRRRARRSSMSSRWCGLTAYDTQAFSSRKREAAMSEIDYRSPVYLQLREVIRKQDRGRRVPCGDNDPVGKRPVRDVRRQSDHGAQRGGYLVREGLLKRVQGKGVFVLGEKIDRDLETLAGFSQTMREKEKKVSIKVLVQTVRPAGEKYASILSIAPTDRIHYIKRVCSAEGEPVSLEEIFIPWVVLPRMEGIDLSVFSLYEVYGFFGIHPVEAYQTLDLVCLDARDANVLKLPAGSAVMLFESISYDQTHRPLEFARTFTRGDRCDFSVHFYGQEETPADGERARTARPRQEG